MKKSYKELSLFEFHDQFATEKACRDHLISMRWPEGFTCEYGSKDHCYSPAREEFHCYSCDGVTSPTAGTLFHRSQGSSAKMVLDYLLVVDFQEGSPCLVTPKGTEIK